MFRFKTLELMNWDLYPHYKIPLDGEIILVVGQNGSGKTTFLDALRVLLNASRLSKKRTLHHYIQKDVEIAMIKAVVTNTPVSGKRPFAHLGIYGNTDVSLICLINKKSDQRIEKEFFIVKGDPALEDIKNLKGGMKPLQYSRQLEEAGVSRSTLKLIALEQGQTDRIGQLSPQDMLQMVMDITGNRDIIKGYEEARMNYRKSSHQLIEMRLEYNKICQNIQHLKDQAISAQNYKELIDSAKKIEEEKLPISKYYKISNEIYSMKKNYEEIFEKRVNLDKRIKSIEEEKEILRGKTELLNKEQGDVKKVQIEHEKKINSLHQKIGQCHSEWQRLDDLRCACESIPKDFSVDKVEKELEETQEDYFKTKSELANIKDRAKIIREELKDFRNDSLPTYPGDVYKFRNILKEEEISHLLFAECIEIKEPKWQVAIESHLGRERFTVFVDEKDFLKAKKLGEKFRYNFYITTYDKKKIPTDIKDNSILSYIKVLDDRISSRVVPLKDILLVDTVEEGHKKYPNNITITVQGYRQDRRGGIFIAKNVKFYCGRLAADRQKKELEEELEKIIYEERNFKPKLNDFVSQIKELEKQIAYYKKKEDWENSKERHEYLKKHGEELLKDSEELIKERNKILEEIEKFVDEKSHIVNLIEDKDREKKKIIKELEQMQDIGAEKKNILKELEIEKEKMAKLIPPNVDTLYAPEAIESPEWLEHKLKEINYNIESFIGCKDLTVIPLYEHEAKELDKKKNQLLSQESDQSERSEELEKCRKDYKEMIDQTIHFYNDSIKELASLAKCRMRIKLEWGVGESLIEDAKLFVKLAFDQKREVDIRDKSLSGGQDVIASLILLVALSQMGKENTSGFFIMDEHNAHLDMLRIMEVGHFLRSTKAQFILTTPTTENVAALAVADLLVTFTKKTADTSYAPRPRYIRRV